MYHEVYLYALCEFIIFVKELLLSSCISGQGRSRLRHATQERIRDLSLNIVELYLHEVIAEYSQSHPPSFVGWLDP